MRCLDRGTSFCTVIPLIVTLASGCGDDLAIPDDSTTSGGDSTGTSTPTTTDAGGDVNCDLEAELANKAEPTPVCNGGELDEEAAQEIDELDYPVPGPVLTSTPALVGAWSPVVQNGAHLPIRAQTLTPY